MELFRVGGLSSEDLMVKDKMNTPQAFYGSVWKFSKDKTQKQVEQTKKVITQQKLIEQGQLPPPTETEITSEITKDAAPVTTGEQTETEGQTSAPVIDRAYLEKLTYPEVQTLAAAEGISNITLKKQVLIDKILESKSR